MAALYAFLFLKNYKEVSQKFLGIDDESEGEEDEAVEAD